MSQIAWFVVGGVLIQVGYLQAGGELQATHHAAAERIGGVCDPSSFSLVPYPHGWLSQGWRRHWFTGLLGHT